MTHAEIFTQVLSEVTGRPRAQFAAVIALAKQRGPAKWDEELSPAAAERLLTQLRAKKAGILNWILAG